MSNCLPRRPDMERGERGGERERKGESKREIQRSETKGRGKEELSHKNHGDFESCLDVHLKRTQRK